MTQGIRATSTASINAATNRTAAADVPAEPTVGGDTGLTVDQHKTARHIFTGIAVTAAIAGAALIGSRYIPSTRVFTQEVPHLMGYGIGALGAGALSGMIALGNRPKTQAYAQVVTGSRDEALKAAAGRGEDVGIVPAGSNGSKWGLIQLAQYKSDIDATGADAFKVSNPPIQFSAITSRDGDAYVRQPSGSFQNTGSPTAIDARQLDATSAADRAKLSGARIGTTATHGALSIGAPLLDGKPAANVSDAMRELYDAGISDAVLVSMNGGVVAYAKGAASPSPFETLTARGTGVSPVSAVTVVNGGMATGASAPGRELGVRPDQRSDYDVRSLPVAKADALTGRRIAGADGSIVRLGAPISTHTTEAEADAAAAKRPEHTLIAHLADGYVLYPLPKAVNQLATAIGPVDHLTMVNERKRYTVGTDGTFSFAGRSVPFDVKEAEGAKLEVGNASGTAHFLASYKTNAEAVASIKGTVEDAKQYAVIHADGPAGAYHVYQLKAGGGGPAWDQQLGATNTGAWLDTDVNTRKAIVERKESYYGTDTYYSHDNYTHIGRFVQNEGRVSEVAATAPKYVNRVLDSIDRAYDPSEAIGSRVRYGGIDGRISNFVRSTSSLSEARSYVDDSAARDSGYVVLEHPNNFGRYHVYQVDTGYSSSSWNTSRAEPVMSSWTRIQQRAEIVIENKQGQYGTDRYFYDVLYDWRERLIDERGSTSITDRTGEREVSNTLNHVDYAPAPPPPATSPGDGNTSPGDGGTSPGDGGSTSPGDGGSHSGGSTSPGDGGSSGGSHSGGSTSPGDGGSSGGSHSGGSSSHSGSNSGPGNPSSGSSSGSHSGGTSSGDSGAGNPSWDSGSSSGGTSSGDSGVGNPEFLLRR